MESSLELEFKVHYKEVDTQSGKWTGIRIRRLCNLLKLTQEEFARFLRLPPHQLASWITSEKWPGCIKLLLDLTERSAFQSYLGKSYTSPLFPNGRRTDS